MKALSEHLSCRGKNRTFYCRRRIPTALLAAYPPGKMEIVRSLRTSNEAQAKKRLRQMLVGIDAEFADKARALQERQARTALHQVPAVTPEQLQCLAQFWVRQVLLTDTQMRRRGMSDEEFDERDQTIAEQRAELGKMLARGQVARILPALRSFLHLCGLQVELSDEQAQQAGYVFLEAVVTALDHQSLRQAGKHVDTDAVAPDVPHPATVMPAPGADRGWDKVFETWQKYVPDRPQSTVIAYQTPWRELLRFAAAKGVTGPAQLTKQHLSELVEHMHARGLRVTTLNRRLGKLKEIFRIAVGKEVLACNPAETTLGFGQSAQQKRQKRRLPFTPDELHVIFGSAVFTQHLRSFGQSGEAAYWIPLIMFYTGARPEEIAGLELNDIRHDPQVGWYFDITDVPDEEDAHLFEEESDEKKADNDPEDNRRRLKTQSSRRKIPVAKELLSLGLLRYIDWVREQHAVMLFPTLRRDSHGKLCGAFCKWFGRFKQELGFTSQKKVLYSLRHNMKDFLEAAQVPSKYLKRVLGHASGDGPITDGYGLGVPLDVIHGYFNSLKFPEIPAQPWQPGVGYWRRKPKKAPRT